MGIVIDYKVKIDQIMDSRLAILIKNGDSLSVTDYDKLQEFDDILDRLYVWYSNELLKNPEPLILNMMKKM